MTISTWKFRRSRATSQEEELRGKLLLEAEERARRRLRETGKTELFGGLNVGNHGNMWNLWNVDQAPKCCDISILYLHEGIEDACPYLQHPATMNPNWAWHVYLLVVPPPPCYAATLLRLASRSELPQLEQRAKEALEMKAMDGSAVHCFKSHMAIPRLFRNKGVVGWYVNSIFTTMTCMTHCRKG